MGKLKDVLTDEEAQRAGDVFGTHQRFIESVAAQHADPDHVPDIVQDVAMRVCRGLNGFRSEANITTWLYRVTVNAARSYVRTERRQHRLAEAIQLTPMPDLVVDPDDQLVEGERSQALHEAVDQLKPLYRAAIHSYEFEAGNVLPCSRWTRHRARQRLKRLLADDPRLDFYGTGSDDDTQD